MSPLTISPPCPHESGPHEHFYKLLSTFRYPPSPQGVRTMPRLQHVHVEVRAGFQVHSLVKPAQRANQHVLSTPFLPYKSPRNTNLICYGHISSLALSRIRHWGVENYWLVLKIKANLPPLRIFKECDWGPQT